MTTRFEKPSVMIVASKSYVKDRSSLFSKLTLSSCIFPLICVLLHSLSDSQMMLFHFFFFCKSGTNLQFILPHKILRLMSDPTSHLRSPVYRTILLRHCRVKFLCSRLQLEPSHPYLGSLQDFFVTPLNN